MQKNKYVYIHASNRDYIGHINMVLTTYINNGIC